MSGKADMSQSKSPPDQKTVAEQFFYLVGGGVGPDIKVFRLPFQKEISDTPTDQICFVAMPVQPVENLETVGIKLLA
jgi:hypothetical protein